MRLLRWKTLWGGHLSGAAVAPRMFLLVGALSLLPSLAGLLGVDFGLHSRLWVEHSAVALHVETDVVLAMFHALVGWSAALLALIIALFAFGRSRAELRLEALLLAAVLPFVALLDGAHGLAAWRPSVNDPEGLEILLWTISRATLALALTIGAGIALVAPRARQAMAGVTTSALLGGAAVVFAALAVRGDPPTIFSTNPLLQRPWDLLPLAAFLAGGFFIFPQLHRSRPSVMSHALILSCLPQSLAQLEAALGALRPWDSHFVLAHYQQLLAYATLLGGILLDYIYTQRRHEHAMSDYETAQLEIRKQTQELERVDRELGTQALMRREAERSLRILEMAVQTMSMGVTVTDLEGKILYVNPADAAMHGYTVPELLGTSSRRYAPRDEDLTNPPPNEIEQPWTRERINTTREGRLFPVRLVSNTVYDQNDPIAMVTICEDISERKRIEQALARRDRILEAIGFAAETFLADVPWEESVEEVLERLKEATGVERIRLGRVQEPSVIGRRLDDTWTDLESDYDDEPVTTAIRLPTADALFPRWRAILRQGTSLYGPAADLPEGERTTLEARGVRSFAAVPIFVGAVWLAVLQLEDGDARRDWSQAELEVLRTAARTIGAAIQRRQDEAALAASQAKFQDLLESANDLIQSVSPTGRFQFVNRAWKDTLGYSQEEVSRLNLWKVIHRDHHARYTEILRAILAGDRETERVEVAFVTKSGAEIYVEGSLNCRFVDGHPVATRGIFRDITERKMIDRMKQEFISTVSHELRTPLTSIIASLGLLESGRLDPDRSRELISVAHRNGLRLLQLINDLLDLQKLALGKISYRTQSIEVDGLIEDAVDSIASFAESFEIDLVREEIESDLEVFADRDRLIQVLNNLISNAIKFSSSGDRVTVGAQRRGPRVVLSVADNGPGIPKAFEKRLFEQFTQVDSSATRKSGGSGLGLSIVKGLVEGMGGEIHLETELGQGTTFYVFLPRVGSEAESEAATDEMPPLGDRAGRL